MEKGQVKGARLKPASLDEARHYLERAQKFDTTAGVCTLEDICAGAEIFLMETEAGEHFGAYALKVTQHSGGAVGWVAAMGGALKGVDIIRDVLPAVEKQFRGCDFVAVTTIRRGLIKKLMKAGYEVTGITLRKRLP